MMKRLLVVLILLGLCACACAECPVYFEKSKLQKLQNDKKAVYTEGSPFEEGSDLMRVDILGIRQGDCIIVTCGGERMLIDGGEGWHFEPVLRYLEKNGIDGFDAFFLTHAHDDHIEIMQRLVHRDILPKIVYSIHSDRLKNDEWVEFKEEIDKKGVPYQEIKTGDVLIVGGAELTIYRSDEGKELNNRSAASMLRFGDATMFLGADISVDTQRWLMRNFDASCFDADIYKVCHHGNNKADKDFLAALSPALAIITNTRANAVNGTTDMNREKIPWYTIPCNIHLETDGRVWYVWLDALE